MPDLIAITDNNDSFEIKPHYDDNATDMEQFESWNSVDVNGGQWIHIDEEDTKQIIQIAGEEDIGSLSNNIIVLTIDPDGGTGAITASSTAPSASLVNVSRVIGVLNFVTDSPSAAGEYPTTPAWSGQPVIENWTQYIRSTQYTSLFGSTSGSTPQAETRWASSITDPGPYSTTPQTLEAGAIWVPTLTFEAAVPENPPEPAIPAKYVLTNKQICLPLV